MLKVSLIVSVYNKEEYVEKCILSLLAQSYRDTEIIVFNNASTDKSQIIIDSLIEKYSDKIKAYQTDNNVGAGGGRNKGMEYATGDYYCFVDSDDYIGPDYISKMVAAVEDSDTLPDIVLSNFTKVAPNGDVLYRRIYKNADDALFQSIAPWGKMFNSEYVRKNGIMLRNIPFAEDVLLTAEIILTKPRISFTVCDEYYWLYNETSTSNVAFRGFPAMSLELAFEYLSYIKSKFPGEIALVNYFALKYCVWYLLHSGRNSGSKRMNEQYRKAFELMKSIFPDFIGNIHLSVFRPANERGIVRYVVLFIFMLKRIGFARLFFSIYSNLKVDKFWPKL